MNAIESGAATTRDLEISIVMPCLNEARTIGRCVAEAQDAIARCGRSGEVVVADNGSTDGSRDLAAAAGARVVPVAERGYGNALRAGFSAARGRYLVMGDADLSYDFSHLPRFLQALDAGYELVMGNRFRGGIQPGAMPWKNRYIGNPVLSLIGRLFFGGAIGDFHCGLRALTADGYRALDLRTTGMEFASEMVIKAQLQKLRITEVPTVLRKDDRDRAPHLRPWRDGWRHLRFMLLFSPRWLFLYPGLLLMVMGLVVGGSILPGPLAIGEVLFDINTLLFSAVAVLVGFKAVAFAILSAVYAVAVGLRPPIPTLDQLQARGRVELGVAIGGGLTLLGLGLALGGVWYWGRQDFGDLSPQLVQRWIIPGALAIALGCEMALASCFLGVLNLRVRTGARNGS